MIRIVDENELDSLTKKRSEPPGPTGIHAQIERLKGLLASKEAEIERLRSDGERNDPKAKARQDVLNAEIRERDGEIERLKDRHVRDVEIIARLHDNIDELRVEVESLKTEILELRRTEVARPPAVQQAPAAPAGRPEATPPVAPAQPSGAPKQPPRQGHTTTFMASQPGNEPPAEENPMEGAPVVHPPGDDGSQVIQAEQVPFEGEVQDAVVIPIDGQDTSDEAPKVKYRPLD